MSMTDLPLVSLLRSKMQWHQARQKVLAENVANANTPKFKPNDLAPLDPKAAAGGSGLQLERTSSMHLTSAGTTDDSAGRKATKFETRPSGNAVTLEDEMLKVGENQSDYQLAASLYGKSLALLKTAVGAKGA